mmetsp:Transcript_20432/g.39930  ORF Transcript_20432/g.39930 Transcript_20432/m.39930 type:complete len:119 (+) Transcript_20432:68-424(+)
MAVRPTLAEQQAKARRDKLELLALTFAGDLKKDCKAAHELGRRTLTWGAVVPCLVPGIEEEMDEVLGYFSKNLADAGFNKIEWCRAQAPTTWVEDPCRHGSHVHMRLYWDDEKAPAFE